jgi:hypothetical protein
MIVMGDENVYQSLVLERGSSPTVREGSVTEPGEVATGCCQQVELVIRSLPLAVLYRRIITPTA